MIEKVPEPGRYLAIDLVIKKSVFEMSENNQEGRHTPNSIQVSDSCFVFHYHLLLVAALIISVMVRFISYSYFQLGKCC